MRQSTTHLSIWDALHWASAGNVVVAYVAAAYAAVNHVPFRPRRYYYYYYYDQLRVGAEVGLCGLVAGELLLGSMAVLLVRRGGAVHLPEGLSLSGRWLKGVLRPLALTTPGLVGSGSLLPFGDIPSVSLFLSCSLCGWVAARCF